MSASAYLQFLQSPSTGALAEDASITYVTTTTTINEPLAILKHLSAQAKQVVKKDEKVLSTIQGDDGACIETTTTLLFRESGGAYLPGIDGNLLDDKEVVFPLTHVVGFSSDGKIRQVRLYWDQGTLLRQVEAIGKSGRNWPIRDGKAQSDAVSASIKAGGKGQASNGSDVGKTAELPLRGQAQKRDSVSATRDPHASLSLFAPRDPNEDTGSTYDGPRHAVRASAKPAPRDLEQIIATSAPQASAGASVRSPSPTKDEGVILKSGAGKHYPDSRLFDDDEENDEDLLKSPERKKTYDQKYQHFAFGQGEEAPKESRPASRKQGQGHQATFSFEDFSTPPKVIERPRPDHELHWGPGIDGADPGSPPKRPVVHSARPDQNPHFEMLDNSPLPSKPQKSTSLQRQRGQGLYKDPIHSDDRVGSGGGGGSARNTGLGVNNSRRGDEFGAHYTIADVSPAANKTSAPPSAAEAGAGAGAGAGKRGARSDMQSQWGFESPAGEKKIYKTAGDGMGSRAGGRAWGIGDESDPEIENEPVRSSARGRRAQQQQQQSELEF